ncbi:hypothetical protein [Archangium sp.]|uniref:hypothetical protein n=1 Tax=Archangium sp. TaxID=1872627 RepID=UPI002D5D1EEB|nr:hypothetical protein [Archangium sp.]HYO59203.1 hypothetical protein [Archangium sp.]
MSAKVLTTEISLPPGVPSSEAVRDLLKLALEDFRWFEPRWYGFAFLDRPIDPARIDYAALTSFYEDRGTLCVTAQREDEFILLMPARGEDPPCTGSLIWKSLTKNARKDSWRAAHAEQVARAMRLLGSPLAVAALEEDFAHKTERWVPDDIGQKRVFTVRDYSEGLAALFWRNFYGPPFLRLFSTRLDALPRECLTRLGEDIALVQPYALPTEVGSQPARARERQLISLLGPECFYDPERHVPPSRRPVLQSKT